MLHKAIPLTIALLLASPFTCVPRIKSLSQPFCFLAPVSEVASPERQKIVLQFIRTIIHDFNNARTAFAYVYMIQNEFEVAEKEVPSEIQELDAQLKQIGAEVTKLWEWLHSQETLSGGNEWQVWLKEKALEAMKREAGKIIEAENMAKRMAASNEYDVPQIREDLNKIREAIAKTKSLLTALYFVLEMMQETSYVEVKDLRDFFSRFFAALNSLNQSRDFSFVFSLQETEAQRVTGISRRIKMSAFLPGFLGWLNHFKKEEKSQPDKVEIQLREDGSKILLALKIASHENQAAIRIIVLPVMEPAQGQHEIGDLWKDAPKPSPTTPSQAQAAVVPPNANENGEIGLLLVDDEGAILRLNERFFEENGFKILGKATSVQEGSTQFKEILAPRVLVITDFDMKAGGIGTDLAREIRQVAENRGQCVKILMMTANSFDPMRKTVFDVRSGSDKDASSVDSFIRKPFDLKELLKTINNLMAELLKAPISANGLAIEWSI